MEESRVIKIENPERVYRMMNRFCQSSLQLILRKPDEPQKAVRGRAVAIIDGPQRGLRISNISELGMQVLSGPGLIRVEFRGTSANLFFDTVIQTRETNSILVRFPAHLSNHERRQNQRCSTTEQHNAFWKTSLLQDHDSVRDEMCVFEIHRNLCNHLRVSDISEGGICTESRFAFPLVYINRGQIDLGGALLLPMRDQIQVPAELRWFKKIREAVYEDLPDSSFRYKLLMGWQFKNLSPEDTLHIKAFMRSITLAEAI